MAAYETSIATILQRCYTLLLEKKQRLAVAESCTGGWISKCITDQPGSSAYYWGGVCSYANEAKQILLRVPKAHIEQFGAVSEAVAQDMAEGIRRISESDFGVAVTGVAGPDGGTPEKPVGLVYIAVAKAQGCTVKKCYFQGDRREIRLQTVEAALQLLWEVMRA